MFGFGKPKSYLGVDLGAGGVKVVELRMEKHRPILFTYGLTVGYQDVHRLLEKNSSTPAELLQQKNSGARAAETFVIDRVRVEKYANVIRSVCSQARVTAKHAVASLPVSSVFHAVVTLPIVKKEDFDHILKAEVKKLLPYPIEEMSLDYQTLPDEDPKTQRVLVNAVPRALVVFFTEAFKMAGLALESLEPESVAVARSLIGRDTAVTVLVDIGAERTNFFIIDQGVPLTHHSIEMGGERINAMLSRELSIDGSGTEQLKRDLFTDLIGNPRLGGAERQQFFDRFLPIVDPILKEIEFGLELYLRQSSNAHKRPEKVVLTGGGALFPYLTEYIAEKFKLKCYVGDPWGRVVYPDSLKPILRPIGPRMAVAIGLALRNMV